jgi:hypothetical protein
MRLWLALTTQFKGIIMATDIVGGLFGITPQAYEEQSYNQALQRGEAFGTRAGLYASAAQLGRGIGGALGAEDPTLLKITAQDQILKSLDFTNPNSIATGIERATQAGIPELAYRLIAARDEASVRQQRDLAARRQALVDQVSMQAYQPGQPERPQQLDVQEQQQMADQGTPIPPNIPAVPASYDISRVAPQLQLLGSAGMAKLKESQPEYKVVGDSLYKIPVTGEPTIVSDAIKGESFTGDFGNASLMLFGTSKVGKIPQTPEAMTAVAERAAILAQSKRPVTNVNAPITVNTQKGFGTDLTETLNANLAGARSASPALTNIQTMQFLLEQGVKTGFGQQTMLQLGQAGQMFNKDLNIKGLAGQEAFQAYSNQVILPEVKKLGVNPTDSDLRFIVQGSPSLSKTPAGNALLLDALSLKLQRERDLGRYSNQWMADNEALILSNPLRAQSKFNTDVISYQQTSPLYTQALDQLKAKFNALGGSPSGASPAGNALRSGGFVQ